jgi:hypothetical protein
MADEDWIEWDIEGDCAIEGRAADTQGGEDSALGTFLDMLQQGFAQHPEKLQSEPRRDCRRLQVGAMSKATRYSPEVRERAVRMVVWEKGWPGLNNLDLVAEGAARRVTDALRYFENGDLVTAVG